MSDVRALLKAKRQEARVNHPLASYSASGQLRCTACGTIIKQAAAWNGHVGSKAHRTNAAKLRDAERAQQLQAQEESPQVKRKSEALESDDEDVSTTSDAKKQRLAVEEEDHSMRKPIPSGFPADFFSDPSRAPPPPSDEEDGGPMESVSQPPVVDEEWARFEQAFLNPSTDEERREAFERATVVAEPILASDVPEGFPQAISQDSNAPESLTELTEEEIRQQKEQEERELIMDRLMDEERAQEEADAKVTMLKSKVDALKRKREAAKAARTIKKA